MSAERTVAPTQVGIVGAGPAGLMPADLLGRAGIDSIVVDLTSDRPGIRFADAEGRAFGVRCDVRAPAPALVDFFGTGDASGIAGYSATALERVWKTQSVSCWATHLLHAQPGENSFHRKHRLGELRASTASARGAAYSAESCTGRPEDRAPAAGGTTLQRFTP